MAFVTRPLTSDDGIVEIAVGIVPPPLPPPGVVPPPVPPPEVEPPPDPLSPPPKSVDKLEHPRSGPLNVSVPPVDPPVDPPVVPPVGESVSAAPTTDPGASSDTANASDIEIRPSLDAFDISSPLRDFRFIPDEKVPLGSRQRKKLSCERWVNGLSPPPTPLRTGGGHNQNFLGRDPSMSTFVTVRTVKALNGQVSGWNRPPGKAVLARLWTGFCRVLAVIAVGTTLGSMASGCGGGRPAPTSGSTASNSTPTSGSPTGTSYTGGSTNEGRFPNGQISPDDPTGPAGIVRPPSLIPTVTTISGTPNPNATTIPPPQTTQPQTPTTIGEFIRFNCSVRVTSFLGGTSGDARRVKVSLQLSTNKVPIVWVSTVWDDRTELSTVTVNPEGKIEFLVFAPGDTWPVSRVFATADRRVASQMCVSG